MAELITLVLGKGRSGGPADQLTSLISKFQASDRGQGVCGRWHPEEKHLRLASGPHRYARTHARL